MKLSANQYDHESLASIGSNAAKLIKELNYQELGQHFGYMLSFGKEPSAVIQEQIASCLSQQGSNEGELISSNPTVEVKYFKSNGTNLFALVECKFPLGNKGSMLAEFVVTTKGSDKYVSLEQIS